MRKLLTDALYTEIDSMREEGDAPNLGSVELVIGINPDGVLGTVFADIDGDVALVQAELLQDHGRCEDCKEHCPIIQTMLITEEEAKAFVRVVTNVWPGLLDAKE